MIPLGGTTLELWLNFCSSLTLNKVNYSVTLEFLVVDGQRQMDC